MKVDKFLLMAYDSDKKDNQIHSVEVPLFSRFMGVKAMHDGIYVWYIVPSIETTETKKETFLLANPATTINEDEVFFIDIVDVAVNTPKGEGTVIFPVFKVNNNYGKD